jgi:hypothetical protein
MNKEIICYAIIPLKNKEIVLTDFDNTNTFKKTTDILCINSEKSTYNTFTDTNNILILGNSVDCSTFIKRLHFCINFLFKY